MMRVFYMGTPDFAVPPLRRIYEDGHEIVGVFTQPDKPKGRGMKMTPSPVKEFALEHGIKVYQPETLRSGEAANIILDASPDLIVVVAYGRVLPKAILEIPRYGCVNVHASLLPKYRGASPIQWAVANGEDKSGVTTMYLSEGLDEGDMILKSEVLIRKDETAGELHDELMEVGAELLSKTLKLIACGSAPREKQESADATYAPILTKEHAKIDFSKSAKSICDLVRGMNPWPCAHSTLLGQTVKIFRVEIEDEKSDKKPGEIVRAENGISVACGDGKIISIKELQLQGGRRMSADDFLRGHKIDMGVSFT